MKLASVTLSNFRCFGPKPQVVPLDGGLAALLGSNGAGKSSVLAALSRVFGLSSADRTLVRGDFHVPSGKTWDDVGSIELTIELRFELPELNDEDLKTAAPAAMFKHLTVSEEGGDLFCCARLKAKWSPSTLAEGDIEQELVWVLGKSKDDKEITSSIGSADRAAIVVHYIPAARDPIRHIRQSTGSILHGFLKAVSWSDETKNAVSEASETIRDSIGEEVGMKTVTGLVEACWKELHKEGTHTNIVIQPVAKRIEDLISQVDTVFSPTDGNAEAGVETLSDGQRSLFYIALVAMSFDVQARLREDDDHGLEPDKIRSPVLTILAMEEPENHVSPHYLGRIVGLLKRIADDPTGQVVLTSHSAAIMARIEPESVRHLRLNPKTKRSKIRRIVLPKDDVEKEKFIREAVKAYPELYFSKLVVLGEGDSEELVIPRLAKALGGVDLDPSLISFVPLGGRHVNHFWRLLKSLRIPHVTLLDLDLGRNGGGWGRIKYALEQLIEFGEDATELLAPFDTDWLSEMHKITNDKVEENLQSWIDYLEKHRVFFSSPLDLDFAMLEAFPDAYQKLQEGEKGPQKGKDEALVAAVLAEDSEAAEFYLEDRRDLLAWYRFLFLGRGKPATHALSLLRIKNKELVESTPDVFKRLVAAIAEDVVPEDDED